MTESNKTTLRTSTAIGPAVSRVCEIGVMPSCEYLPTVGLKPTIPFKAAGIRTEPPVSVPSPP